MKTIAWILTARAPASLIVELQKSSTMGKGVLTKVLVDAHRRGWIKFVGMADGSLRNVASVIEEHFDARITKVSDISKSRGRRHGRKKQLE